MKKKVISISIGFLILFFTIYSVLPHFLAKHHNTKSFQNLGLEVKKQYYGKDFFEYVEGGEGPTLLLVHGFQSSKSYWLPYMKKLSKNYKIIAFDLPGHGNSSAPKNQKYNLDSLSASLEKFVDEKKLENFHLIGASMGGGVVSVYAYHHPEKLATLTLLNPLGIDQGIKSDLQLLIERGKNLFFPNTLDEFDELAMYLTGKQLSLGSYLKKYVLKQMIRKYGFFKRVFNELITSTPLDDILPKIKTKSLIIMGQKDRIIHPQTFEYFVDLMPNIKPVRIENGYHSFVDENFDQAVNSMSEFLENN